MESASSSRCLIFLLLVRGSTEEKGDIREENRPVLRPIEGWEEGLNFVVFIYTPVFTVS